MITMEIKDHAITPNQKVVEVRDGEQLIATIVPTATEINVISKFANVITEDWTMPPKITIHLTRKQNPNEP